MYSMNERDKGAYGHVLKYTGIFGGVQGLNVIVSLVRNKFVGYLDECRAPSVGVFRR